jgi:hypothetical protein
MFWAKNSLDYQYLSIQKIWVKELIRIALKIELIKIAFKIGFV